MNRKILLTAIPILALLTLGGLNISRRIVWKAPHDGVVWQQKADRLTAIHVEEMSQAYLVGIRKGDVLYRMSIKNQQRSVSTPIDVTKVLWEARVLNLLSTSRITGYLWYRWLKVL